MNMNSDHHKAVVVETMMMGLLVSGLVWLKTESKQDKGIFQTFKFFLCLLDVSFQVKTISFVSYTLLISRKRKRK